MVIIELGTLLGFLSSNISQPLPPEAKKLKKLLEDDQNEKNLIKSLEDDQNEKNKESCIGYICSIFLGENAGDILSISYGPGNTDYEVIIRRSLKKENKFEILSDLHGQQNEKITRFTGYTEKSQKNRLGSGDMLTFNFLSQYLKERKAEWIGWDAKTFKKEYEQTVLARLEEIIKSKEANKKEIHKWCEKILAEFKEVNQGLFDIL
jgi:hypothetical protein